MVTILRQCRSWHVARAKLGVPWTTPKTLYLNNRTTGGPIALIWYALEDPLVTAYAVVRGGVSLHVRTCTPRFYISRTAEPIALIFGM